MSEVATRPVGRPTLYTPERGDEVLGWMSKGFSLTATAGAMGVARQTLLNWAKDNPEFLEAITRARSARTFALERDMLGTDISAVVNARRFALVNAAPEEWREKIDVDHGVQSANPLATFLDSLAGRGKTLQPVEEPNRERKDDDAPKFE